MILLLEWKGQHPGGRRAAPSRIHCFYLMTRQVNEAEKL
jgi:hypothetical protein